MSWLKDVLVAAAHALRERLGRPPTVGEVAALLRAMGIRVQAEKLVETLDELVEEGKLVYIVNMLISAGKGAPTEVHIVPLTEPSAQLLEIVRRYALVAGRSR